MNRKPQKVLTIFVIVSILTGWNGISPLSMVVWGNPVLIANDPVGQVEASDETAKRIVKRSIDLALSLIHI